jgi:hypothetical protein
MKKINLILISFLLAANTSWADTPIQDALTVMAREIAQNPLFGDDGESLMTKADPNITACTTPPVSESIIKTPSCGSDDPAFTPPDGTPTLKGITDKRNGKDADAHVVCQCCREFTQLFQLIKAGDPTTEMTNDFKSLEELTGTYYSGLCQPSEDKTELAKTITSIKEQRTKIVITARKACNKIFAANLLFGKTECKYFPSLSSALKVFCGLKFVGMLGLPIK